MACGPRDHTGDGDGDESGWTEEVDEVSATWQAAEAWS